LHRSSIVSATGNTITISNGTVLPSDVLIFATGWTHPYLTRPNTLFSPSLAEELELPVHKSAEESPAHAAHWAALDSAAADRVHILFPILKTPPKKFNLAQRPMREFSYMHHLRFLVPPGMAARNDRSIVFMSNIHVGATPLHAALCSLWSYAYMEDLLPAEKDAPLAQLLKDQKRMEEETAWETMFFRLRYLDLFEGTALAAFETREVCDRLMTDLGIRWDRHAMLVGDHEWFAGWKKWWREYFGNYGTAEYATIVDEYLQLLQKKGL
jgi:hypothetical protein